jgi:histidinol phosphatase-like enzyme
MSAVNAVNAHVDTLLACHDLFIEGWFVCPHAPDMNCDCRKPKPGLLYQAQAKLGLDLKDCWVIGDKPTDVMLARAVGGRGILVGTGHSGDGANWALANGHDFAVDLNEAAEIIVRSTKRADRIGLL